MIIIQHLEGVYFTVFTPGLATRTWLFPRQRRWRKVSESCRETSSKRPRSAGRSQLRNGGVRCCRAGLFVHLCRHQWMFHRAPTRRTVTDLLEAQRKGTRRETLQLRAGRSCSLRNRLRVRKTAILAVEIACTWPWKTAILAVEMLLMSIYFSQKYSKTNKRRVKCCRMYVSILWVPPPPPPPDEPDPYSGMTLIPECTLSQAGRLTGLPFLVVLCCSSSSSALPVSLSSSSSSPLDHSCSSLTSGPSAFSS